MDELRGDQAVWRFDGETVAIRYNTKWFTDALLKKLGQCEVPVHVVDSVDFRPGAGKKKGWILHLHLKDRTDPYSASGAELGKNTRPFMLTGPAKTELLAEYYADQIAFSVDNATVSAPPDAATRLVPQPPLHIQTSEGTAVFNGSTVRLVWSGSEASSRKRKQQRREYPLADIASVEWIPSDGWEYGYLRVVTRDEAGRAAEKPKHDFACLLFDEGAETVSTLLMAATVTAHLWAHGEDRTHGLDPGKDQPLQVGSGTDHPLPLDPGQDAPETAENGTPVDTAWVYEQIEALGGLHDKGVLTDDEFTNKKAELLDRI